MYKLEYGLYGKSKELPFLTFESALMIAKAMSLFAKELNWKRTSLLINSEDNYSDVYEEGFINISKY